MKRNWSIQNEEPISGKQPAREILIDFSHHELSCVTVWVPGDDEATAATSLEDARLIVSAVNNYDSMIDCIKAFLKLSVPVCDLSDADLDAFLNARKLIGEMERQYNTQTQTV